MNPYEMAGRLRKANALALALRQAGISAELAATMDETQWTMAERIAGVKRSSPVTREQVLVILRLLEQPATADSFEGFDP